MKYGKLTLGQIEALVNKLGGEDSVEGILSERLIVTLSAKVKSLLSLPATEKFVAKDNFLLGKNGIGYLGENFQDWFLDKIEEPVKESTLHYHLLTESSLDAPVLKELGDNAETTLANLFHLLSLQAKGQSGVLLTNGYANIFYVRDCQGELRTVIARWIAGRGCWCVSANSVTDPGRWGDGSQVFSRNS